jgi:hypothetical protein
MDLPSEDNFNDYVKDFFTNKLKTDNLDKFIEVRTKVNILRDITIGYDKKNNNYKIYFGFQEQDIVLSPRNTDNLIPIWKDNNYLAYHWLQKDMDRIIIPFLVCELKTPKSMVTHQFITYSKICEQIKEVFPYCDYFFILSSNKERKLMPETVLRQGKSFDRVFLNFANDNNERDKCWKTVYDHLLYLQTEMKLF